jgi:hypothetical protein
MSIENIALQHTESLIFLRAFVKKLGEKPCIKAIICVNLQLVF